MCSGHSCFLSHCELWKVEKIWLSVRSVFNQGTQVGRRHLNSGKYSFEMQSYCSYFKIWWFFSKDLRSYYINNRCMWLLIFHIPPCSLPWKTFEVVAGLFPVGLYFTCESSSGHSSVRKQNFPIIIWRSPSDHATTCRDRWWVLIFLQEEGSFVKSSFCNTVCCGSEVNRVIGMKDADLMSCVGVRNEILGMSLSSVVL